MGAMAPKSYDLKAQHEAIATGAILGIIDTMNAPVSDAYLENMMMNGKVKIVTDLSEVVVGDMARAGIINGRVTAVLNSNRIIVLFDTQDYVLKFGVDPTNRQISVDYVDNAAGLTDEKKLAINAQLLSTGIVFLRDLQSGTDAANSNLSTDKVAAASNNIEVVTATVWSIDKNGQPRAADTVVVASTGSATVSGVTDNADGSYTATLTNAVAETTTITATIDGTLVGIPDGGIDVVWSV